MKITTTRRISQALFLVMFLWFCIVATVGERFWQLRGWPVNWLLQLDPLVAISTATASHTLPAALLWALATVVLTIIFGRFFCGWVCPLGTMNHFVGWLGKLGRTNKHRIELNRYRRAQNVKYYILIFLLAAALGNLPANLIRETRGGALATGIAVGAMLLALMALALLKVISSWRKAAVAFVILAGAWIGLGLVLSPDQTSQVSLQTGLLDPIPLVHRSVNLAVLPMLDAAAGKIYPGVRLYELAWLTGAVFLAAIFLNLLIPRFYCRFVCPLGGLFGVIGRPALLRVGKKSPSCPTCKACEIHCEGGCSPAERIRTSECVLCFNCLDSCAAGNMTYQTARSAAGEIASPDVLRRGLLVSLISGIAVVPILRLAGKVGANWNPKVVRPPGSREESEFLARCIKCGQCMRVCPTNVLQPAGLEVGLEGLWTPVLNNRIGTSGCQLNCVECGGACPTGAIRGITLDEKLGRGKFADAGPVKLGTAFVDQSRCLPFAMDRPCLVCQENCPVSPKAIYVREHFSTIRGGRVKMTRSDGLLVTIAGAEFRPGELATGDYYFATADGQNALRARILDNTKDTVTLAEKLATGTGRSFPTRRPTEFVYIQIKLERPYVDPKRCIGCGICEHECPVSGLRAIRVTAEGETRSKDRSLLA